MRAGNLNLILLARVNCSGLILQPHVQPLFLLKQRREESKKGQLLSWRRTKVELEKDPKRQFKGNFLLSMSRNKSDNGEKNNNNNNKKSALKEEEVDRCQAPGQLPMAPSGSCGSVPETSSPLLLASVKQINK